MFKKIFSILLFSIFLVAAFFVKAHAQETTKEQIFPTMIYFYGDGCPHCEKAARFLTLSGFGELFKIEKREIYFDRGNAQLYLDLMDSIGVPENRRGVPALVVGGERVVIGDQPIIDFFSQFYTDEDNPNDTAEVSSEEVAKAIESVDGPKTADEETTDTVTAQEDKKEKLVDITLFPVIAASVVDAVNPCAFAVLIILMTTILMGGDKTKALKSGFAFAAAIFISYLMMGLGLYRALTFGRMTEIFYKVVGWLAIVVGLLNLKDWLWYGKGFLMEVPMSWRPVMKRVIKSVTSPGGAFSVGFVVSLFLLPCTSGPYIVILGMLAKSATYLRAVFYLVIYNIIFVSPMLLITYAVYKGFNPEKAEEIRQKRLRTLHLIAGILMVTIGVVVLLGWI